jgi:Undecaprenyl-phosphate glucose phosphotransferase
MISREETAGTPSARHGQGALHRNVLSRSALSRNGFAMASDLLPLCDFVCLFMTASLSTAFYLHWLTSFGFASGIGNDVEHAKWVAAVLAPFILYDKHFGAIASRGSIATLVRSYVVRFAVFVGVILALGVVSRSLNTFPLAWLVIWFSASLCLTSVTRALMVQYVRRLQRQGVLTKVIAVVGAGPAADRLMHSLRQTQTESIEVLGVFDDKIIGAAPSEIKSSGNLDQLIELGKTRKIDWIVLTLPPTAEQRLQSIAQRLRELSVPIGFCPEHVGLLTPHRVVDYVGDRVPVRLLADRPIKRWDAVTKVGEDYLLGGIITLLLLPVLAGIALAIKLTSRGPIIFKQRRHAVNNCEFNIYKFRTMLWDPSTADESLRQTTRYDGRITRVGRFLRATSLDELPQLFNVLKGEMSLVGPRPHAVNMRTENQLGQEITDLYTHRHRVKPGITGWSQVNGARGATDTVAQLQRRVELDLHYIENWSLLLDLKILALTSRAVIRRTNAY